MYARTAHQVRAVSLPMQPTHTEPCSDQHVRPRAVVQHVSNPISGQRWSGNDLVYSDVRTESVYAYPQHHRYDFTAPTHIHKKITRMDTGMCGLKVHTSYVSASTNTASALYAPDRRTRHFMCHLAMCGRETTAHTHGHVRKCSIEEPKTTSYIPLTRQGPGTTAEARA